jgi:hypothetical protein
MDRKKTPFPPSCLSTAGTAVIRAHKKISLCILSTEKESKSSIQGMNVFRYVKNRGSLMGWVLVLSACQPQRNETQTALPSIFPDAARALGPFSIHLEKSRESSVLSEARVKVEQAAEHKQVTLQIRMMQIQEQVTLSFLHQGQDSERIKASQGAGGDQGFENLAEGTSIQERVAGQDAAQSVQEDSPYEPEGVWDEGTQGASRCLPRSASGTDATTTQSGHRAPSLHDAATLFHIPLPRSIREASSIQVTGAGERWRIQDEALVWDPKKDSSTRIALSWTRDKAPETRYPLQAAADPQNLRARRIDKDGEESIPVSWDDGFVLIDEDDVRPGSWLELQYDLPDREKSFVLPQMPAFGNMNILSLHPDCPRESFLLERNDLSWNCPPVSGPLWAVSYSYRQTNDLWEFKDWPELARQAPSSVTAFADAGEQLDVEIQEQGRVIPKIPPEASRVCLRASWSSNLKQ